MNYTARTYSKHFGMQWKRSVVEKKVLYVLRKNVTLWRQFVASEKGGPGQVLCAALIKYRGIGFIARFYYIFNSYSLCTELAWVGFSPWNLRSFPGIWIGIVFWVFSSHYARIRDYSSSDSSISSFWGSSRARSFRLRMSIRALRQN